MDSELTLDSETSLPDLAGEKQQVLLKNNFSSTPNADANAVRNPCKKNTPKHMSQPANTTT